MKKNKPKKTLGVFKSIFNIRQWTDYDRMRAFTHYVGDAFKRVFVPQKIKKVDTKTSFKEAVTNMHMTEEGLERRKKALYRLSILMTLLGFCIFLYTIYQLVWGGIAAAVVSLVLSAIGFVLAFRYHFWYFQIRERKLGCTLREWYEQGLLGKKP